MTQRPFMASLAVAGYAFSMVAFVAIPDSAYAQAIPTGCDPATGLGVNGQPCVELTPLDPNRLSNVSLAADGSGQYNRLDTSTLGQTYACRELDSNSGGSGGGTILFEDCGTPLTGAELGELKPFYGSVGTPAPAPAPVAPAPAPVAYVAPPPAPVVAAPIAPPAPPAFAPVSVASSGLGGAGLIAAGVGAAAVIGIAAIALSDDDDDDAAAATNTN